MKVAGSGFGRSCSMRSMTDAPAACARPATRRATDPRRRDASALVTRPTSAARSVVGGCGGIKGYVSIVAVMRRPRRTTTKRRPRPRVPLPRQTGGVHEDKKKRPWRQRKHKHR